MSLLSAGSILLDSTFKHFVKEKNVMENYTPFETRTETSCQRTLKNKLRNLSEIVRS